MKVGSLTVRAPCGRYAVPMDDLINLLQWPAMAITLLAAWLVGSEHHRRRKLGFWCFLGSNALWVAWGLHDQAWALIILQLCLVVTNLRGAFKNDDDSKK